MRHGAFFQTADGSLILPFNDRGVGVLLLPWLIKSICFLVTEKHPLDANQVHKVKGPLKTFSLNTIY